MHIIYIMVMPGPWLATVMDQDPIVIGVVQTENKKDGTDAKTLTIMNVKIGRNFLPKYEWMMYRHYTTLQNFVTLC